MLNARSSAWRYRRFSCSLQTVPGNLRWPGAGGLVSLPGLRPLVLLYHAVADHPSNGLEISPDMLRRQLVNVLSRGLSPVTVSEALAQRDGHVAVTFDDASSSIRELALPVLRELGIPATAFVPPPSHRMPGLLTIDDLEALVESGWEIGSHTCSHPFLTHEDDAALAFELERSRHSVEAHLDRPCRSLAYPYGDVDPRVVEATRAAGYESACTLSAVGDADALAWPRVALYDIDRGWRLRLKLSSRLRRAYTAVARHPRAAT